MSGGSMDYVFGRIYEAACQVKDYRREVAERPVEDFEFDARRTTMTPEELKTRVLQYLDNGVVKLREAEVFARRIEWLSSGDDGFDDLIFRTNEDLAEVQKSLSVTLEPPKPYVVNEMRDALSELVDAVESWRGEGNPKEDDGLGRALLKAMKLLGRVA